MTTHRLIALGALAGLLICSAVEAGPRGGGARPAGGRGASGAGANAGGTSSGTTNAGGAGRQCSGLAGSVTSVDATALTFVLQPGKSGAAAVTVTTTAETQFVKSDGTAGAFADVVVGAQVKVEGTSTGTDAVTATNVQIGGASGGSGGSGTGVVNGTGTVSNVDPDALSFVVQPQRSGLPSFVVTTTAETQFVKSDGSAATFADVVTGTEVCAQGTLTGTDTIAATKVLIKLPAATTTSTTSRGGRRR